MRIDCELLAQRELDGSGTTFMNVNGTFLGAVSHAANEYHPGPYSPDSKGIVPPGWTYHQMKELTWMQDHRAAVRWSALEATGPLAGSIFEWAEFTGKASPGVEGSLGAARIFGATSRFISVGLVGMSLVDMYKAPTTASFDHAGKLLVLGVTGTLLGGWPGVVIGGLGGADALGAFAQKPAYPPLMRAE
jgi:hypothetical protein